MENKHLNKPHQRVGSISNAHVGRDFEAVALDIFAAKGINLQSDMKLPVGVVKNKKLHAFDLGCEDQKIIANVSAISGPPRTTTFQVQS